MDAGIVFRVCVRERADELCSQVIRSNAYPRKSAYSLPLLLSVEAITTRFTTPKD